MGIIAGVVGLAILAGILAYVRKAGKDAVKAESATEALKDVTEANRPVSVDERDKLRESYRRD